MWRYVLEELESHLAPYLVLDTNAEANTSTSCSATEHQQNHSSHLLSKLLQNHKVSTGVDSPKVLTTDSMAQSWTEMQNLGLLLNQNPCLNKIAGDSCAHWSLRRTNLKSSYSMIENENQKK